MSGRELAHLYCLAGYHLEPTHPLWQYLAIYVLFLVVALACVWATVDQWKQRRLPVQWLANLWMRWCYRRKVTLPTSRFARTVRWVSWHVHPALAGGAALLGLVCVWVAGAVLVGSFDYALALRAGVPGC